MDFSQLKLLSMLHKKMTWLGQRQDVLSENIANSDTPDYKPTDLVPLDFRRTLSQQFVRLEPKQTSKVHLAGTLPLDPQFRNPEIRRAYESSPDGNEVVLEEQMVKMTDTKLQYEQATQIYRKYGRMFKVSIGRGGA